MTNGCRLSVRTETGPQTRRRAALGRSRHPDCVAPLRLRNPDTDSGIYRTARSYNVGHALGSACLELPSENRCPSCFQLTGSNYHPPVFWSAKAIEIINKIKTPNNTKNAIGASHIISSKMTSVEKTIATLLASMVCGRSCLLPSVSVRPSGVVFDFGHDSRR